MSVITQDGESPLMWAAKGDKTGAVVVLVKSGADLNLQNKVSQMYILALVPGIPASVYIMR